MDVGCKTLWITKKTIVGGRVSVLPYRRYRQGDTSCGNIPAIQQAIPIVGVELVFSHSKYHSRRRMVCPSTGGCVCSAKSRCGSAEEEILQICIKQVFCNVGSCSLIQCILCK